MKTILILNIVGLAITTVTCVILFVKWYNAERKLAKYGESTIYKKQER